MLNFTGHPFIDIGIAVITVYARKERPNNVTEADLDEISVYLYRHYCQPSMRKLLNKVFPNSPFTNTNIGDSLRRKRIGSALRSYKSPVITNGRRCNFCDRPAVSTVSRAQLPLLNSEDAINFSPEGRPGLPICGICLLAVHAMPLGCLPVFQRSQRGINLVLLAVHSENNNITMNFAVRAFRKFQTVLQLQTLDEIPSQSFPKTRLVESLIEISITDQRKRDEFGQHSLIAYHFTNENRQADLEIIELPSNIIKFLYAVSLPYSPAYEAWQSIQKQSWQTESSRKKRSDTGSTISEEPFAVTRNTLYEDLFDLPDNLREFLPRHQFTPARGISDWVKNHPENWALLDTFLRKVIQMDRDRVEAIREMGDRIAEHILQLSDQRLYRGFAYARYYGELRQHLWRASERAAQQGGSEPLLPFELYSQVFLEQDDTADLDWRLARDLVLVRIVERLHEDGWFAQNPDIVEDTIEIEENQ